MAREFIGLLAVVVNEKGDVIEAKVQRGVLPLYDIKLVGAAMEWKFQPAVKDGQPVRYRALIEVKLVPSSPSLRPQD